MSRKPGLGSRSRDTSSKNFGRYKAGRYTDTVQARWPDLTSLDSTNSSCAAMARSSRREDHVRA